MNASQQLLLLVTAATLSLAANADDAQVRNGEYMARAADCVACHTTPGGKPFAGGREFKLPFGSLYTPNITPDKQTGIGDWSDDDFVSALQEGVGKDGKHYYPAFPYTSYTRMSREDILAIKTYLFSLPAIKQPSRENDLTFPFNQRWGMAAWNLLFLDDVRYQGDPNKSLQWNRGAYLVEGPGHCGECHTPRNLFQAMDNNKPLAGALVEGWQAYNISSDSRTGIGAWPEQALVNYLRTGWAPGYGVANGPMGEVVEHSLQHLNDDDLKAIATYLKTTAAQSDGVERAAPPATSALVSRGNLGHKIFMDACASCHRLDGTGNQSPAATLAGLKSVNDPNAHNMLGVLLAGNPGPGTERLMPAFAKSFNDTELAAVTSFVLAQFGQSQGEIDNEAVAKRRKSLE